MRVGADGQGGRFDALLAVAGGRKNEFTAKIRPEQAILKVAVTGGFQAKRRKIPMKKTKLLFADNEPREEIKTRIPVWLYPSTLEVVDRAAETANCKSRSEYLERAALFYAGYISGQDATAYLPPALSKVMRGIVRDTENRICRMLFKLAVELDMVMNLLAAAMEIPEARLRELRVRCIENVKKTNGSITMEDAVAYQNGDK